MFQYVYPQFKFKTLLKAEMLTQLRDYPETFIRLSLAGFGEGIVSGCGISWENSKLVIAPGMVYRGGHLYFMETPFSMDCGSDNQTRYLKIQFLTEINEPTQVLGNTRILLGYEEADTSCEIELCRFCLQEGARLRDSHETFEDFSTEYDTINLIHAPFAGEERSTLNPVILKKFALETMKNRTPDAYDVSFAMNVLANRGIVPAVCISAYIEARLCSKPKDDSNSSLYKGLLKILREQEHGTSSADREGHGRKGIMLL